ncbi:MAG: AAA family ATPase [Cytophagaceae bacterium]
MAIIIFGLPGSGKSFLAQKLAEKINAMYISSDLVRKELNKEVNYSEEQKLAVYEVMLQRAKNSHNHHTIIDATFYKAGLREWFEDELSEVNNTIYWIWVYADDETSKKRTSHKRPDSDADYQVYLKLKEQFEPPCDNFLKLSSENEDVDNMIQQCLRYTGYDS